MQIYLKSCVHTWNIDAGIKAPKKISCVSTNSIDPVFGESGIFFFFALFSTFLKLQAAVSVI